MRTRRSRSSSDPVSSSLDVTRDKSRHQSVLLHEAVDSLDISPDDVVVDATLGASGHAREIIKKLGRDGLFIGFDLDSDAIVRAEVALQGCPARVQLINANFRDIKNELGTLGIATIDKALFDLGWSSDQLAAGRGFSFLSDEPIMMTYSKSSTMLTAATIVNEWAEQSIADILFGWGEERYARKIAKKIVERRMEQPFTTSRELAEVVRSAVPAAYRHGKIHPATKTFQALRIAVNDELGALAEGLKGAWEILSPSGRIAVITFHSIEDRLMKRQFLDWESAGQGIRVNKKPLTPSIGEIKENPRSRSAKLRVIEKYEKTFPKNQ